MSSSDNNITYKKTSFLAGVNSEFINEFYADYISDPNSLPESWRKFFEGLSDDEKLVYENLKGPSWSPEKKNKRPKLLFQEKNKNNLSSHLMGGLEAKGVPKNLKNTAFPFTYNNLDELNNIIKNHDIGAIKMEVSRNFKPKNNFLKKIRSICDRKNIVLIFDECTSGFRQTFGGLHKLYNVEPDIAWFGKALGNGYSISAIIGKREIMDHAQDTFMSSTFWTERSGSVAALETLKQMEKIKSWEIITKKGKKVQKKWNEIAKSNHIKINVLGIPALSTFSIESEEWLKYKTFISQEMLKKKMLCGNALFLSVKHDEKTLNDYFDNLNDIFKKISKFENKSLDIDSFIDGSICQSGFQRLN